MLQEQLLREQAMLLVSLTHIYTSHHFHHTNTVFAFLSVVLKQVSYRIVTEADPLCIFIDTCLRVKPFKNVSAEDNINSHHKMSLFCICLLCSGILSLN